MNGSFLQQAEGVVFVVLLVGLWFRFLVRRLASSRPDFRVAAPLTVAFGLRLIAIAGIAATGLEASLRGGDETTYLDFASILSRTPWGHGFLPHGAFQLQTVLFGAEWKLGFLTVGAMRIVQVGIAMTGVILILGAVYDLAGGRAARVTAWILAFEPGSLFFNSGLLKEPNMELAAGLVVFGGTMIWRRLDVRGLLLCGLGGLIAVETRSYAGWFLVASVVLLLLHTGLRSLDRPMRAAPAILAVAVIAFVATPAILQASSKKNLQSLQQSQNANASGAGESNGGGANGDNLALEQVDFSSRGAILTNLPQRIRDVILQPYPWRLGDTSQRVGAIGTLFAYAILLLLFRYAWLSRGHVFPRAAPLLYPLLFLMVAYALSVGNAGTGFRYRTHLVTLAVGAMMILREQVVAERAERRSAVRGLAGGEKPVPAGVPAPI